MHLHGCVYSAPGVELRGNFDMTLTDGWESFWGQIWGHFLGQGHEKGHINSCYNPLLTVPAISYLTDLYVCI